MHLIWNAIDVNRTLKGEADLWLKWGSEYVSSSQYNNSQYRTLLSARWYKRHCGWDIGCSLKLLIFLEKSSHLLVPATEQRVRLEIYYLFCGKNVIRLKFCCITDLDCRVRDVDFQFGSILVVSCLGYSHIISCYIWLCCRSRKQRVILWRTSSYLVVLGLGPVFLCLGLRLKTVQTLLLEVSKIQCLGLACAHADTIKIYLILSTLNSSRLADIFCGDVYH